MGPPYFFGCLCDSTDTRSTEKAKPCEQLPKYPILNRSVEHDTTFTVMTSLSGNNEGWWYLKGETGKRRNPKASLRDGSSFGARNSPITKR